MFDLGVITGVTQADCPPVTFTITKVIDHTGTNLGSYSNLIKTPTPGAVTIYNYSGVGWGVANVFVTMSSDAFEDKVDQKVLNMPFS